MWPTKITDTLAFTTTKVERKHLCPFWYRCGEISIPTSLQGGGVQTARIFLGSNLAIPSMTQSYNYSYMIWFYGM